MQRVQHKLVIPTVDTELGPLADALRKFIELGIKLPLCSAETLAICRDKYALLTRCKEEQLPAPDFTLLTEETISSLRHFPYFGKPRKGAGGFGALTIKNSQALQALPRDGSYLVQELLPGDEYSVDVYIDALNNPIAAVPRLRMKVDSGVAVTARTCFFPELAEMALKVAKAVGIRYVANIQFKANLEGTFKLLEINPRFSGTLPLTSAAGVDIPKLLIQEMQESVLPEGLMPFKELMVVRYWTEHFFSPKEWESLCQL